MQTDQPTNSDPTPLSDPSSPTLGAYRHHPQPTPTVDPSNPMTSAGMRQRHAQSAPQRHNTQSDTSFDPESIRLQISIPSNEEVNARREVVLPRSTLVKDLKDGLASGRWNYGDDNALYLREGMRLIWRGRRVNDEEVLGDIVKDIKDSEGVFVFHLVATRKHTAESTTTAPPLQASTSRPAPPNMPITAPTATTRGHTRPFPLSRNSIALGDTIHYLLFMARHYLCRLLNAPPLGWSETVPRPVIEQSVAREAVMTVIRICAEQRSQREEGWENWEGAFASEELNTDEKADRAKWEAEIKSLWSARVGRNWSDRDEGESVTVELDEIQYQLHLPPLRLLTTEQLSHLLIYLRIASLIPLITPIYEEQTLEALRPASRPPVNPSTLLAALQRIPLRNGAIPPPQRRVLLRLRVPVIPLSVLSQMAFSALKIGVMLWMLTRDMAWTDFSFWILAGAGAGYWVGDVLATWARARPPLQPALAGGGPAQPGDAGVGNGPGAQNQQRGEEVAGAQPEQQAQQRARADAPVHARAALPRPRNSAALTALPLIHLSTDSQQLGHPSIATTNGASMTTRPSSQTPPRWQTQFLLPVALWFMTLIPEWENMRARAIRARERAIRVTVGELTTRARTEAAEASGQSGSTENSDRGTSSNAGERADSESQNTPVLPTGLNAIAKRYYERVLARGEGIDWEEEREAQRALGIGEEPEEGDGMRMRML